MKQPIISPVIHMINIAQVRTNINICLSVGINHVFLINHSVSTESLLKCANQMRLEFPDLWIGINPLGEPASFVLQWNLPGINALWLDETINPDMTRTFKGLVFGGLAFKYQPQPIDIKEACEIAKISTDVACTSGPGTGKAPMIKKIEQLREFLGDHPLAIASGVSSENVHLYKDLVDYLLVATSITGKGEIIDIEKLKQLIEKI